MNTTKLFFYESETNRFLTQRTVNYLNKESVNVINGVVNEIKKIFNTEVYFKIH